MAALTTKNLVPALPAANVLDVYISNEHYISIAPQENRAFMSYNEIKNPIMPLSPYCAIVMIWIRAMFWRKPSSCPVSCAAKFQPRQYSQPFYGSA